MLPLSLSYDHRVIDGADAVRFTTRLGRAPRRRAQPGPVAPVSEIIDVSVPDIGDFEEVEVVEMLVVAGRPGRAPEPR